MRVIVTCDSIDHQQQTPATECETIGCQPLREKLKKKYTTINKEEVDTLFIVNLQHA